MTQTNTTRQFIQVSAHKDSKNFMHCSNLSLMSYDRLSPSMALAELEKMASEYESNGYTYSYFYRPQGSNDAPVTENFLYPQAGINFLSGITVSF